MGIETQDVPYLPRGVRLHECKIRKGWFLLAPERALKMDQIGAAILAAVDGVRSLSTHTRAPADAHSGGDSVIVWVSVHSPALCGSAAA